MTNVTRLTLDDEGGLHRRRIHLREISDDSEAPLDTVGQDLRTARLRRGDDLATVSRVLKIRKDHLEALEEDRIEALPGRTYAVGFIRSYADYLGLDAVQCVDRFKAEIAGRSDPAADTAITVIDEDAERRMPHGWKIMAFIGVVLAIYAAYQLAISASKMVNEPAEAPVTPRPVAVARPASPPPKPVVTEQPAATVPVDGTAAPAADGTTAPAQPEAEPALPQGTVYGEMNRESRVVLRVYRTARVVVIGPASRPGEKYTLFINRTLKPGDSYRVPNVVGATLTTSDAGAVQIELDGTAVGMAGHGTGPVETLSLDPQSLMDRNSANHGR